MDSVTANAAINSCECCFDRPPRHRLQRRKIFRRERLAAFELRGHLRFTDRRGGRAVIQPNRERSLDSLRPKAIALVIEEFPPSALSILPVGDGPDADPFLHGHRFADTFVLDAGELRLGQLPGRVLFARAHQALRARQTAHMLGTVWRLRISHRRPPSQFGMSVRCGVPPAQVIIFLALLGPHDRLSDTLRKRELW
jgi:hypothetical protein